ncbi:MAG: hypothetical protein D6753_07285 [Planctomycetota bacterium]|nr:MAG: hypothetical protein D6753_07285 [Planctomycetota bacterium]
MPGRHDATFLRAIAGLISCWLVWQLVQVGRHIDRFNVVALVGAGMILVLTMIALTRMSGQAPSPSVGPNVGQAAMGTIREVDLSEAEQNTPGLSIYRYELDLPPGDWKCEVWTELWKDGQLSRGPIHLPTVRNPKRFELQWREGEALSPEGEGKVRWDFFAATRERALVLDHGRDRYEEPEAEGKQSSGGWIDDPFAEASVVRGSTWRGTEQWPLVPNQEQTLLILHGHKTGTFSPPAYAGDPNQLARRIEEENAHADVELYLKLRVTPAQPAPSNADAEK